MIKQNIYLEDYDWRCIVYYDSCESDAGFILDSLRAIGCDGSDMMKAWSNLSDGKRNTGLTFSNTKSRCSVVVISKTTSASEFQDTFDHEKGHLSMHISKAVGIEPFSEDFQYLNGKIGHEMFKVAKMFLCDCCRKRLR